MTPGRAQVGARLASRTAATLGLVLALTAGTTEGRDLPHDLSGVYICEGTAAEGAAYRGFVRITLHDDIYVVRWLFARGDAYTGIGVVNGNAFAVTYVGSTTGVAVYTIEDATRLVGTWTVAGAGGRAFSETLTKVVGNEPDGTDPPSDPDQPRPQTPPPGALTI